MIHGTANVYNSQIGHNTRVAAFAEIGGATVGRHCKIQAFAFICPGVTIGDECLIGPHVCFTNDRHPRVDRPSPDEATHVGHRVAIGAGAVILSNLRIGDDATIGAGAVVTRDVEAGQTVAGNPARPLTPD